MRAVYLICLTEPDREALETVRELWPDEGDDRYELSDTQILVVHRRRRQTVYDRIERRVGPVDSLIVRVERQGQYQGFAGVDVWEWLADNVGR